MTPPVAVFLLVLGLVLLWAGGEVLVRFATHLAIALGMSPLTIGLTVVAFATSGPELFASLVAAIRGAPAIALNNVIGSNIANLGLVLGISGLIVPIHTEARFIRRELPFMILVSVGMLWLMRDDTISRLEGGALLGVLALFLWWLRRSDPNPTISGEVEELEGEGTSVLVALAGVGAGVALLGGGAFALVEGAVSIAERLGLSQRVIGLTMVAFGTSLPELASCIVAAARKAPDLILGNLVGSNIMNILLVLGATAVVTPIPAPFAQSREDLFVMTALCVIAVPFLAIGLRMNRFEAGALIAIYGFYIASLF